MPLTTTARQTPNGIRLEDGYRSLVAFDRDPNIELWEIEVKPPGIDGGDQINTTTMHNTTWRSMASRALMTLTESTIKFAYDPLLYTAVIALCNREGAITQIFPDGSTLDYYGYLKRVEFDPLVEGTFPTGTATIVPTNVDPITRAEVAPVVTAVLGT